MRKFIISNVISTSFILLFTYAAASKLFDFTKFRVQLGLSPILTTIAGWVAWFIPVAEISIALLLISRRFKLAALYASFSLMTMFTTYIIAITQFSDFVPCSCGGVLQNMSWNQHIIFNVAFMIAAFAGILLESKKSLSLNTLTQSDS